VGSSGKNPVIKIFEGGGGGGGGGGGVGGGGGGGGGGGPLCWEEKGNTLSCC